MRASRYMLVALPLLLIACGGGSTNNETSDSSHAVAAAVRTGAPPVQCPQGGITVDTGIDTNDNGVLDVVEVTNSQYVCHGAPGSKGTSGANGSTGSNGTNALVRMIDEPAGAHCAAGGRKTDAGLDVNADGTLDASEVTSTGYVCHGAAGADGLPGTDGTNGMDGIDGTNGTNGANGTNGTNGSNGSDGLTSLVAIAAESAGGNCTYGGNKVTSGIDTNGNGVLDVGEVNATSYVCNAAPAGIPWVSVTDNAVQAEPNKGYLAKNDAEQVVVNLPTNPVEGDVVRVNGLGAAGWRIAQNAGQQVLVGNLPGGRLGSALWGANAGLRSWSAVASSATGRTLAAAAVGDSIHVSNDGGLNWTPRGPAGAWKALAMSADGGWMIAGASTFPGASTGHLHRSANGGQTWTELTGGPSGEWVSIASSFNGRYWAAAMNGGQIHTSEDWGVTWNAVGTSSLFARVAMSSDGSKIVAGVPWAGVLRVHVLTRNGGAWSEQIREAPSAAGFAAVLSDIALSADGSKLWAAQHDGYLYSSIDDGVSWTPHLANGPGFWRQIGLSGDGHRVAAVGIGTQVVLSTDSGMTWRTEGLPGGWTGLVSSVDGTRLLATQVGVGLLYGFEPLAQPATSAGTAGSISGRRNDALELQYLGGGQFNVLSHEGTFDIL